MAQTGLTVAMVRVECGQAPWPPQHGSIDQHACVSQGRRIVVVISVMTSGAAGRRWRRQTGQRRDATGHHRRRCQQHHASGRRRAAGCTPVFPELFLGFHLTDWLEKYFGNAQKARAFPEIVFKLIGSLVAEKQFRRIEFTNYFDPPSMVFLVPAANAIDISLTCP